MISAFTSFRCKASGRLMVVLAAVSLVAAFAGVFPAMAQNQTPEVEWPCRYVLTGPARARAGDHVTYTVTYEAVETGDPGGCVVGLIFDWGSRTAASLLSVSAVTGPQPSTMDQIPGISVRLGSADGSGQSGELAFRLDIAEAFVGNLRVIVYVPGTGIAFPEGSATDVTTMVSSALSPAGAPNTGTGPSSASSNLIVLGAALALAGAVLVGAALGAAARR